MRKKYICFFNLMIKTYIANSIGFYNCRAHFFTISSCWIKINQSFNFLPISLPTINQSIHSCIQESSISTSISKRSIYQNIIPILAVIPFHSLSIFLFPPSAIFCFLAYFFLSSFIYSFFSSTNVHCDSFFDEFMRAFNFTNKFIFNELICLSINWLISLWIKQFMKQQKNC